MAQGKHQDLLEIGGLHHRSSLRQMQTQKLARLSCITEVSIGVQTTSWLRAILLWRRYTGGASKARASGSGALQAPEVACIC